MSDTGEPAGTTVPWLVPVLLTFTTGAVDVIAFVALDKVFASVMTGNLVLLGLAGATRDAGLAVAAGLAFAGYAGGALGGARTADAISGERPGRRAVLAVLTLELLALLGFGALWLATGGRPGSGVRHVLLVVAAAAMGLQGSAVKAMGSSDLSTTYLTGTLTKLLFAVATRHGSRPQPWDALRLMALVVGATVSGLVLYTARRLVPLVPWCAFGAAVALALLAPRRLEPPASRGTRPR